MALRFSLFKTPNHKVYNYRPIYYDPVKEEFQERVARIHAEMAQEAGLDAPTGEKKPYHPGISIRGSFRKASRYEIKRRSGANRYTRGIAILSIVALIVAILYFADGLGILFESVSYQRLP